jgi:hypothetical protein
MALPSSGVLTLDDIQTEFGGTNPISLSEYYRGGGLVPDSALNAAIPTSGAISVGDFYGSANSLSLDLTLQGGAVSRINATYTGVSIGTANTNRMVIIQGGVQSYGSIAAPTSITLNGTAMTLLRPIANSFIAYLKVPTGTTATLVISGGSGGAFNQQIITINTVNAGPNQTSIQNGQTGTGTSPTKTLTQTMTTDPVATNGVFIWGGNGFNGVPTLSLLTSNSSGVTTTLSHSASNNAMLMGYSECTTADSRNAQIRNTNNETSGKINSALYSVFAYFQAD